MTDIVHYLRAEANITLAVELTIPELDTLLYDRAYAHWYSNTDPKDRPTADFHNTVEFGNYKRAFKDRVAGPIHPAVRKMNSHASLTPL